MKLLEGKNALIFGVANDHSIAWGITRALHEHGANLALSYASPALKRRVVPLAEKVNAVFAEECDVAKDEDIDAVFAKVAKTWDQIDILLHAIAFADREELKGAYYETSREGFHTAMDISVYSFTALARAAAPMMTEGGSMMTVTHYGGDKVMPNYNVMGVAKAALESSTRYLAADLGSQGIRVNAISAGPIRTLSAAGVSGFKRMYRHYPDIVPLRRHIDLDDVGGVAVWLASDLSAAVTGEVVFVDAGYNILGVTSREVNEQD
jgi:enoyl-[acyl-carrier protein] reductase I